MTSSIDRYIRTAGSKPNRAAVRLFRKPEEVEQDRISELKAEIAELKAAVEENRTGLRYNELLEKIDALEKELNERGNQA